MIKLLRYSSVLLLAIAAYAAEIVIGMPEDELLKSQGKPDGVLKGPKATIYRWETKEVKVKEGKVSEVTTIVKKAVVPRPPSSLNKLIKVEGAQEGVELVECTFAWNSEQKGYLLYRYTPEISFRIKNTGSKLLDSLSIRIVLYENAETAWGNCLAVHSSPIPPGSSSEVIVLDFGTGYSSNNITPDRVLAKTFRGLVYLRAHEPEALFAEATFSAKETR